MGNFALLTRQNRALALGAIVFAIAGCNGGGTPESSDIASSTPSGSTYNSSESGSVSSSSSSSSSGGTATLSGTSTSPTDFTGTLSKAVVYSAGAPINANTYVKEIYSTFYRASTNGASVLNFGAVGDGMTDDSAAFNAALASSDTVLVPSGNYLLASPVTVSSNKSLIGTSSTSNIEPTLPYGLVVHGSNVVIQGLHFVGKLSSQQQYQQDGNLSTSMFNGETLVDSSGNPVPSSVASFSIVDADTISMTVNGSAGSPSGPFFLTGTIHGLVESNRYQLQSSANFIAGDGALLPTFLLNGNTVFDPENSSNTPYFTAATSLGLKLSVGRSSNDKTSLTATFKVSDLSLLHATNELASIDTATDESSCYIFVLDSQNVFFLNDDFHLFDAAVLKASNTQGMYFIGNTVTQSFGGITSQSGHSNVFVDNDIDNRLTDEVGNLMNHSIIRSHGFALSFDPTTPPTLRENNDQIVSNKIVGASWAIESAMSLVSPNVSFNTIVAGKVGVSLANEHGTITNNAITLDGISRIGIEVPTDGTNSSHDVTVTNNSVDMSHSSLYAVGFSATNGGSALLDLYNINVSRNSISAPIGFQVIGVQGNSESNIAVAGNEVTNLGLAGFIRTSSGSDFNLVTDQAASGNIYACIGEIKFWGVNTAVSATGC